MDRTKYQFLQRWVADGMRTQVATTSSSLSISTATTTTTSTIQRSHRIRTQQWKHHHSTFAVCQAGSRWRIRSRLSLSSSSSSRLSSSSSSSLSVPFSSLSRAISTTTKSTSQESPPKSKTQFWWLDLRHVGLCMIERLAIEEALLRHSPQNQNWIIVGTHHVWPPKYLQFHNHQQHDEEHDSAEEQNNSSMMRKSNSKLSLAGLPSYLRSSSSSSTSSTDIQLNINTDCMVVMGIGGKPESLLHVSNVYDDKLLVCKRFSGGGTVLLDKDSLWTTIIGRPKPKSKSKSKPKSQSTTTTPTTTNQDQDTMSVSSSSFVDIDPYPRSIMEWSADTVFGPTFEKMTQRRKLRQQQQQQQEKEKPQAPATKTMKTLVLGNKGCCGLDHSGKNSFLTITKPVDDAPEDDQDDASVLPLPKFSLRENDYILGNDKKMGGNAQSIGREGWLHHTSFLWDYNVENMERYLKLPEKRPDYRVDRSHDDFLTKLGPIFGDNDNDNNSDKDVNKNRHDPFFHSLHEACTESFDLKEVSWSYVKDEIIDKQLGGMNSWFEQNRTKIV